MEQRCKSYWWIISCTKWMHKKQEQCRCLIHRYILNEQRLFFKYSFIYQWSANLPFTSMFNFFHIPCFFRLCAPTLSHVYWKILKFMGSQHNRKNKCHIKDQENCFSPMWLPEWFLPQHLQDKTWHGIWTVEEVYIYYQLAAKPARKERH